MPGLPERTRVLVIGGGPVGLVLSGLLSRRGVPHVLVERRREPQRAPAAHVLRRRPMEVLSQLGVAEEVRGAAPFALDFVVWCATLGGAEIGRLALGAAPWTNCPQNLLEPILRRAAVRPEATLAFGAECLALEQREDHVCARVLGADGEERGVEAAWVVAADGAASPTRRALGIAMEGQGPLGRFSMVHFRADLARWLEGRSAPLFWILNPASPGCLIVHEPRCSHVFMMPVLGAQDEEASVPARLANALGVPEPAEILSLDRWSPHVQVAARYRAGRVFLVGDAAHRFPPTGGLGLNTGIVEAHDLAERIAAVEASRAPTALLDGYEAACRPAAAANAADSFANLKRLGAIPEVLGPQRDLPALERRLAALTPRERAALDAAIEAQRSHFLSDGQLPGPVSYAA